MLTNMNWAVLIPELRAMMTVEGRCFNCGHPFVNERDIQIEHREPPRHAADWAREHARNLGLLCSSCNRKKNHKVYAVWLDEEEDARLSNEQYRIGATELIAQEPEPDDGWLFDESGFRKT